MTGWLCPEHVIIVAYYLRLLFECTDFCGQIFPFWAIHNENNHPRKFPLLYGICCLTARLLISALFSPRQHRGLGIDVTDDVGMTPLMWAAYNNNPSVVGYLLGKGADREEKDNDGYTAMHW